ncbi:MAG TPA: hypothetical protein VGQ83_43555 [Polyangia bacterium]
MRRHVPTAIALWAAAVAAAVALGGAAGCGLAGTGESFTGIRDPDGIAPWGDLGQPLFCAQPRLVGPPDSEPRGFCVPDEAADGAGCTADSDCRNRERCLCGRCAVQFCDSAQQCGPDRTCSFAEHKCHRPCLTLDDCTLEEDKCDRGVCKKRCDDSSVCQTGEVCSSSSGYCVTADCATDRDCGAGTHCVVQREPWDLRAPEALGGAEITLYVEVRRGSGAWAIWRARSADGLSFTFDPARPVLEPAADEAGRVGAPAVLQTADGWQMFFEHGDGAGLRRARSADGVTWERDPGEALAPAAGWEAGAVRAPSVLALPDGTVALFYEGGVGAGIGLALSPDGAAFTRQPAPVLMPADFTDPVLWREVSRVGQPFARLTRDAAGNAVVGLYVAAFGMESAAAIEFDQLKQVPPNYSIGYAAAMAADLEFHVFPLNPVMDRVVEFLTHDSELEPTVVPRGSGYLMYFTRADASAMAYGNLGVAASPPRF